MTGVAQVALKSKANGSLVEVDGKTVGSSLIGQQWKGEQWFYGRPSAIDYDASTSSGSNLGPTSKDLNSAIEERAAAIIKLEGPYNPGLTVATIPVDLLTSSSSGLDPDISQAAAMLQVPRIAAVRRPSRGCRPSTRRGPRPGSRSRVPRRAPRERARAQPRVGAPGVAVIDVAVRDRIVVVLGRGRIGRRPGRARRARRRSGCAPPHVVARVPGESAAAGVHHPGDRRSIRSARPPRRADRRPARRAFHRTSARRTTSRSWRPGAMSVASDRSSPAYPPRLARSHTTAALRRARAARQRLRCAITWMSISDAFRISRFTNEPRRISCHLGFNGSPTTICVTCWRTA